MPEQGLSGFLWVRRFSPAGWVPGWPDRQSTASGRLDSLVDCVTQTDSEIAHDGWSGKGTHLHEGCTFCNMFLGTFSSASVSKGMAYRQHMPIAAVGYDQLVTQ